MIIGSHSIIYTKDAEADRAFFRDVFEMPNVDVGDGWLIFGLPPSEVAMHPTEGDEKHQFFLMCEDVNALIAMLEGKGHACSPVYEEPWGSLTMVTLPGGGRLGIYQPKHELAPH